MTPDHRGHVFLVEQDLVCDVLQLGAEEKST
jgi:hypothetical protein